MKKKCQVCKKKQLIIIECKCGKKLCLKHKFPEDHNCEFDYKKENKENLTKQLVKTEKEICEQI